ncbi:MAG: hypothetical protein ABJF88_05585 [Rhodothermales bacterium]
MLSVVSAVAAKRQLAGSIHSLGETPSDVVRRAWDGSGFAGLDQHLPSLGSALEHHDQRHAAYPILHYFHSTERRTALGPAVAVLDDALLILTEGVAPDARPAPAIVEPTRRTVGSFLTTLGDALTEPSDRVPPTSDLAAVASVGAPTEAAGDF